MTIPDTSMGGEVRGFPPTPAALRAAPAIDELSRLYWKPVYHYLRTVGRRSNDDAKDLTQQFFLHLMKNQAVERYRPGRGPLRSFLKACLRNFLIDEFRKREEPTLPLDGAAEPTAQAESEYEREWLISVMEAALRDVREELVAAGRDAHWKVFEAYDLRAKDAPKRTYEDLARELGLSEDDVRGALQFVRRRLRDRAIEQVRRSVSDPRELYSELGHLGFL